MRILLLPLFALIELVKRPIFWVLYPFAYYFRAQARKNRILLWYVLDDSILRDNIKNGDPEVEYCYRTKRSAFVEKYLPYDFARSFYWGAWRNNGINFMETTEDWVGEMKFATAAWVKGESFYSVRTFASGAILPYLEVWIGGWRFQCGFISCGRFQVQMRKLK